MDSSTAIRKESFRQISREDSEIAAFCIGDRSYRLDCLTSTKDIRAIKSEWQTLERDSSEVFTYFQSFDWCYQWCVNKFEHDSLNRDAELSVYLLRCDGAVVMIWPMMEVKTRVGAKILTFLTDPLEQYANVLVDRKRVSDKTGCKVWKLIRKHAKVDAITINYFPTDSFLEAILCGIGFAERSFGEASILDLTGFESWEDHHASLSRNQRKQRNRRRSKLEKKGEVTYEVAVGGSERYRKLVNLALDMKQVWFRKTGRKPGILAETDTAKFLAGLTGSDCGQHGCPQGALTHALCVNGNPIAIEIGMVMGHHYYSYLGAFDWAWKDYSPGKIQIEAAQKWAKSVGLENFDFLGDPSDYKEHWTGVKHRLYSRSMPITAFGLIYCAIWKCHLRPRLKNAYKNMDSDKRKLLSKMAGLDRRSAPISQQDLGSKT